MFGYLTAAQQLLSEEQQQRYRAVYCGLCRSLKRRGQLSRFTLNYDMSFLVILLESLYEPEIRQGEKRCPAHPFSPRRWQASSISDYAADMNIALAYMKLRDNWDDDVDPLSLWASAVFKPAFSQISKEYPRQCAAMQEAISRLSRLEAQGEDAPDACAACFGQLMEEFFVISEDRWSPVLRGFANALGRFIYIMDACIDLEKDMKLGRYNPFSNRLGCGDNEQYFSEILKMQLGECVAYFDRLPLVQDADILKNILCFGLWSEFYRKFGKEKEPNDVSGSL